VHALVERKVEELTAARRLLTSLLRSAAPPDRRRSVVCPHIEGAGSGRTLAARRRRT